MIEMFDIAEVRDRLRAETGDKFALVEGVAELSALRGAHPVALPAAYVFLKEEASDENKNAMGRLTQLTLADIGVVIMTNDVSDRHGAAAADALRPLKLAVLEALLGWQPPSAEREISHVGGAILTARDGYVGWEMTLSTAFYLRKD